MIQEWLGHSDLNTTLRYLADAELGSSRTPQQVNTSFAVFKRDGDYYVCIPPKCDQNFPGTLEIPLHG